MSDAPDQQMNWHDVWDLGVRGLAWADEARESPFDRFPATLKHPLDEDLWRLCTESAGLYVDFQAASNDIHVRWTMEPARAGRDVAYMPPLAHSGMDLYGKDTGGRWRRAGSCPADSSADGAAGSSGNGALNYLPLDGQPRTYRLYLPLLRRVQRCEIGCVNEVTQSVADQSRPVAYYGTSIVHGVAVDRPGMTHAAQLGRFLDREIYNLGVSGRAKCEPEIAEALARLEVDLYIVDVLPNNTEQELLKRLPLFLRALRRLDPGTPVLLVGDRTFGDATFCPERDVQKQAKEQALLDVVARLREAEIGGLHVAMHPNWFGEDQEGTADSSHPNTLGARRFAQGLLPFVQARLMTGGG